MKRSQAILLAVFLMFTIQAVCADAPLKLMTAYKFPSDVEGNFDHCIVDVQSNRLFTTPEKHHSVDVFDLKSGKLIHSITGIDTPHALLYRDDLQQLYVTDGGVGALKIFDGKTYKLIKSVKLFLDADSVTYEPSTKYLYVTNGGGDEHQTSTTISVIDTTKGEKVKDIKLDGDTLEAMALETQSSKMYVDNRAKNRVDVVDRNSGTVTASWPVTKGDTIVAIALDEPHHRLFVAARSGAIVVFDTASGKELQALPIDKGVDDLVFDAASKRLYAPCSSGTIGVYEQTDADHYKLLGKVAGGPLGRTGRLVPELKRYFLPVPKHGSTEAEVMVYEVQ
jgi:hypothetical protein